MRNEFWETRLEGRPEMWQALRLASEASLDQGDEQSGAAIMSSVGLTPYAMDKRKADVCYCYDERGFKYEVPMYVLHAPSTFLASSSNGVSSSAAASSSGAIPPAKQNKSKDKPFSVTVRFSTGGDFTFHLTTSSPISSLYQSAENECKIEAARQQAYYQGKKLALTQSLGSVGVKDGGLVQIMVRPTKKEEDELG